MGFQTEFNSVLKFNTEQEMFELLEYGKGKVVKSGFRIYPTGQKLFAYTPDNKAVAIIRVLASIAEINFQGEEITSIEMELARKLTPEESAVLTRLADEMFFGK